MNYNPKSILYWLNRIALSIFFTVCAVIAIPFIPLVTVAGLLIMAGRWILNKLGLRYYDSNWDYVPREKHKKEVLGKQIRNHERTTEGIPHEAQQPFKVFACYEDREFKMPYDAVAFIETSPDVKVEKFLKDDADWLSELSAKYAVGFIKVDYDKIRKGMIFPQDFNHIRHGFVWNSPKSLSVEESDLAGDKYFYFDLDPSSNKSLREQMEDMMQTIYKNVLNF